MKKIIISALLALTFIQGSAQTFHAPKSAHVQFTDTTTTYRYVTNDEKTYNVYRSKSGALYIWKVSKKSGKLYKMYLPKEIQIQMGRKYSK